MTARVTIVGSLNMDLVIRSPHIPQPGETIIGRDFQTIPGGKGANQAVAASRLGGQVNMVGRVGSDAFAQVLLENLKTSGVEAGYVQRDANSATGVALIVVDESGENIIVVASGANMKLSEADVEAAEQVISASDVLLLQLEVPLEAVTRAAQIAQANGVTVVLNPAPARKIPPELLKLVDILVPNESEAELLTGLKVRNQAEFEKAAMGLLGLGVGSVVITLGGRGAFFTSAEHEPQIFNAYQVQPVDTTAAGDAFLAGLSVTIGAGESIPEAVRLGNAAGGLAAMRFGAQTSLPMRDEVLQLINGQRSEVILGRDS
jgi:ribokinase